MLALGKDEPVALLRALACRGRFITKRLVDQGQAKPGEERRLEEHASRRVSNVTGRLRSRYVKVRRQVTSGALPATAFFHPKRSSRCDALNSRTDMRPARRWMLLLFV